MNDETVVAGMITASAPDSGRPHAYRDAGRLLRKALEIWPSTVDEPGRLAVVGKLTACAELCGDHASAVAGLRELLDTDPTDAALLRRLAVQYELQRHWPPALAARESAAKCFAAAGNPGDAAAERLAVATHLRSAASFAAALDVRGAAAGRRRADQPSDRRSAVSQRTHGGDVRPQRDSEARLPYASRSGPHFRRPPRRRGAFARAARCAVTRHRPHGPPLLTSEPLSAA